MPSPSPHDNLTDIRRQFAEAQRQFNALEMKSRESLRDPTESRAGLYPELAAYGFAKKSSAAFEDHITRRAALCPSFEVATRELNQEGIDINVKEVRRIALQCGESLLAMRLVMVQAFLASALNAGNELAGKRVVIEIVFPAVEKCSAWRMKSAARV